MSILLSDLPNHFLFSDQFHKLQQVFYRIVKLSEKLRSVLESEEIKSFINPREVLEAFKSLRETIGVLEKSLDPATLAEIQEEIGDETYF